MREAHSRCTDSSTTGTDVARSKGSVNCQSKLTQCHQRFFALYLLTIKRVFNQFSSAEEVVCVVIDSVLKFDTSELYKERLRAIFGLPGVVSHLNWRSH